MRQQALQSFDARQPRPCRGRWQLTLHIGDTLYAARSDPPIVYANRKKRTVQRWLHMPVSGMSRAEAEAYAA